MNKIQQKRFDSLYRKHVSALKRQGKAETTIDVYSRALRRITEFFDCPPDTLTQEHFEAYFESLVQTHSWSTVKVDRNGLQFFYKYVLKREWNWVEIVRPPKVKTLPDVLTLKELERLLNGTKERRFQTFIFVCFSMGLRLGEVLNLRVGDIDSERMKVHIRSAKGKKDRYVTLPKSTLHTLRCYWATHRHPDMIFPRGRDATERRTATSTMDRGGLQRSFKAIVKDVGIHKDITIHTLRHCYGTLLTEAGVSLRAIQHEMGHECPKTTALYTQLSHRTDVDTDKRINALINTLRVRWGATLMTILYSLQEIAQRYRARFLDRYGSQLHQDQWSAFNAITGCRQGQYGELHTACSSCAHQHHIKRSCGHRSCNQCQFNSTQDWLARQLKKQLPVNYYMATFTLPSELRMLAYSHQQTVYRLLIECAIHTLKKFGLNKKGFEAELGMCAVLHTHTRRLDYHPHVHIVIPGGGVHRHRKEWRKLDGDYLFNGRALASVFRGLFLTALAEQRLRYKTTPQKWIVHCTKVGRGKEALQYLSRYLYRGVIANRNIIADDGNSITFQYRDSKTKKWHTRTLLGETFLYLLLQHVLPKGFRRARDYGFLHGNAKRMMAIVQWVLKVHIDSTTETKKSTSRLVCPKCKNAMSVIGIRYIKPLPD